jgi:hypothetical protein
MRGSINSLIDLISSIANNFTICFKFGTIYTYFWLDSFKHKKVVLLFLYLLKAPFVIKIVF